MKSIFDLFKRTFRCQKLSQTLECAFNVSNNASNKGGRQDFYGEGIKFDGGGGGGVGRMTFNDSDLVIF